MYKLSINRFSECRTDKKYIMVSYCDLRITKPSEVLPTQSKERKNVGDDLGKAVTKYGTGADLRNGDVLWDREGYSWRGFGNSLVVVGRGWWGLEGVRLSVKNVCLASNL